MDFSLAEDQKMLRTMVREFAEKELEPIAAEIDEEALRLKRFSCSLSLSISAMTSPPLAFDKLISLALTVIAGTTHRLLALGSGAASCGASFSIRPRIKWQEKVLYSLTRAKALSMVSLG